MGGQALGGFAGGVADDLADALAAHPPAVEVGHGVGVGVQGASGATEAVEVHDERLDQVRAHLHLADAGFGLGVGDPEAGAVGVVQAYVAQAQIAQLAGPDAATPEDLDHRSPPDVLARGSHVEPLEVVADGRLGQPELAGDLAGTPAS